MLATRMSELAIHEYPAINDERPRRHMGTVPQMMVRQEHVAAVAEFIFKGDYLLLVGPELAEHINKGHPGFASPLLGGHGSYCNLFGRANRSSLDKVGIHVMPPLPAPTISLIL